MENLGTDKVSVWWEPTYCISLLSSHGWKAKAACWDFFYKGVDPRHEVLVTVQEMGAIKSLALYKVSEKTDDFIQFLLGKWGLQG